MFHARDALAALLETNDSKTADDVSFRFEIEAGLQYIREDFDSTFTSLANLLPKGQITYSVLWAIFPPNAIIYGLDELQKPRAWRVRSADECEDQNGQAWLQIEPEHVDYDGRNIGTVLSNSLRIYAFLGARDISDLPYFPIKYAPDAEATRKSLLEMGRRAMHLHGRQLVEYKGHGLKEVPPPRGIAKFNVRKTCELLVNCMLSSFAHMRPYH